MAYARLTGGQARSIRHFAGRSIACLILNCSLVTITWAQDLKNDSNPLESARYDFAIDARYLPDALIQFSQQSGRAIVFPDNVTRNIVAPPFIGEGTLPAVLEVLLHPAELTWELVDGHIITILEERCREDGAPQINCSTSEEILREHPVYDPQLEQTYVYGTQVTGSRIRHTRYEQASPVDIISAPDIELSGAQSVGELLRFVPAVSGNSISTSISNGGNGTATVTLRGLPSSNTLVLINGRRVANDGLAGESVDLNSIPPAAVERIEILKGGASAIYGSDAIAGVVNIIMKQHFNGLLAETYYGEASRGDLQTRTHTLQYGTAIPNGSFFIKITDYGQENILSRDRRVSRSADSRLKGGTDLRSSATETARVTLPDDTAVILDEGQQIKNPDSKAAKCARELDAENRLVLTGTPIENRLMDMWSLMAFAMPGVLGTRAYFKRRFDKRKDPSSQNRLAARLRPFLLRRTKGQVAKDLPPRTEEEVFAGMDGIQEELYKAELKRIQKALLGLDSDEAVVEDFDAILNAIVATKTDLAAVWNFDWGMRKNAAQDFH